MWIWRPTMKENELKPYLVWGGYVTSKNDGDRHYVNAEKVMRLYGLDRSKCDLAEEMNYEKTLRRSNHSYERIFFPRYDGDYGIKGLKENRYERYTI